MTQPLQDLRFWKSETPHVAAFEWMRRCMRRTEARREMYLYVACLYDDMEIGGLGPGSYEVTDFEPSRLARNIVRPIVDAFTAKITKSRPLPMAITKNGDWAAMRRARRLNQMIEGSFEQTGVWNIGRAVVRDAGLYGPGGSYSFIDDGELCHERVFPWEDVVDPREARNGNPRQRGLRRWVDKQVLKERFPNKEKEIDEYKVDNQDTNDLGYDPECDQVLTLTIWHLRSSKKADDGRMIVCIPNATLGEGDWKRDYFPTQWFTMTDPMMGVFGTGFGQILMGKQYSINRVLMSVQDQIELTGGYIWSADGSELETNQITNGPKSLLGGSQPPQWLNPPPFHPQFWTFQEDVGRTAFEESGISQLSAQSQIPAALKNAPGVVYDAVLDSETERFNPAFQNWDDYCKRVAWIYIDLFEELAEANNDYQVRAPSRTRGRRALSVLDYKAVRLDREAYTIAIWSSSFLQKEPGARMMQIDWLRERGQLDDDDIPMLLDMPDTDHVKSLRRAQRESIEERLDTFLDAEDPDAEGLYKEPEPFDNLQLCMKVGIQVLKRAELDGAPDPNLDLVRQFILSADTKMKEAEAAKAGNQGGAPAGASPQPAGPAQAEQPAQPAAEGGPPEMAAA